MNPSSQSQSFGGFGGRLRLALVALAVAVLGLVSVAPPAGAAIDRSDLPTRSTVKTVLDGVGPWRGYTYGDTRALGARPGSCRSDLQMGAFRADRGRGYYGSAAGSPADVGTLAKVDVYRYASVRAAKRALTRNASYPDRCPRVVEWVCTQCDGVWTTWRTRVPAARVGAQSVAWRFREISNAKANGYTILARRGATVVRVTVGRERYPDDGPFTYPERISKKKAISLARIALRTAT
ncbi:MAG: hypothetical protein WCF36_00390 [Candidatus Nanopelagicales bacterium]